MRMSHATHASDLDAALRNLILGAVKFLGHRPTRPKLVVLPDGPDRFLAPAVKLFWPHDLGRTSGVRPVYVPARDVIDQGTLLRTGVTIFDKPSVIFFEPLDEIEADVPAQEAISDVVKKCSDSSSFVFVSYSRKPPENMNMTGKLMDVLLNRRAFDVDDWSMYREQVRSRDDFYLRESIKRKIDTRDGLRRTDMVTRPDLLEELADVVLEMLREHGQSRRESIIDEHTGLMLPPEPRTAYQDRIIKYGKDGKKINVIDFLKLEWGDYTRAHLLYAEHIRDRDPSLYKALHYQATVAKKPFAQFLLENGILGKDHLLNPPMGFERQAKLLQSLRHSTRAAALDRIARQLSDART